ncbi:hypothetical protein HN011_007975 [Eciton burchellii]|nr:hypothetical protein HN011_007975 [Eciton burchellii]
MSTKPAINKIVMLPKVLENKHVLQSAILKHDVLSVFTEWLTPIQNGSLPSFKIRNNLLQLLSEFSGIDKVSLKRSGIGKAVMYLHKHPKETKSNKEQTRKLVES